MKKIFVPLAAACLLLSTPLTRPTFGQSGPSSNSPSAPPIIQGHHHSAIRAAISSLERAKAEMEAAAHDYGGHRVDAIAACDTAIAQLNLALQFANQNNSSGTTEANP
jgi:hypothetical protein